MIPPQRLTIRIIHEPCQRHPIRKHKGAYRIVIQQGGIPPEDILDDGAVALEVVREGVGDCLVLLDDGGGHLGVDVVVVADKVLVGHAGFFLDQDGHFDDVAEVVGGERVAWFEDHVEEWGGGGKVLVEMLLGWIGAELSEDEEEGLDAV